MAQEHIARERELFVQIFQSLPPNETARITDWLCETASQWSDEGRVLDVLCAEAMIQKKTLEGILQEVLTVQSADLIVPLAY